MEFIDRTCLLKILERICIRIKENRQYLTELDAAVGDADHGINMERGFNGILRKLGDLENQDIGKILQTVGMDLVSLVGGASGPLYGTAFIEGGKIVKGKMTVDHADLVALSNAGLKGIKKRGRSHRFEKTMIDAIEPALDAFRSADSILEGAERAAEAAYRGVEETIEMIARKGRASYLGKRSIGHKDPGAVSSALMIDTAFQVLKEIGE